MQIEFSARALAELAYFQKCKPKTHAKIETLLHDIIRSPYRGLGKPEPLKHEYAGWWSRRISDEHRLVYRVDGNIVHILQCRFHYDE